MAEPRKAPRRHTRADYRASERTARLQRRLDDPDGTPRDKVSWASAHLRAVMADPAVTAEQEKRVAQKAVIYLKAVADELEASFTATTRREQK